MTPLKALLLLLAPSLLALQVTASNHHQHQHIHKQRHEERHEENNSTLESRYVLPYPYNPLSTLKRGLPFNNPSKYIQTFKGAGSKISWAYNWDSYMDPGFPKNMEFVPMLWGDGADHTANWAKNVNDAINRGCRHILAFNEPDGCSGGGSCMSPQQAVNAYKKHIQPFKGRAYLGAPAVTNGPAGLPWLKEFLRLCTGCQVDFLPVHWYDSATNDGWFKLYMSQAYAATGSLKLKLWVTEFNGSGTLAQKTDFLRRMMPWMDSQGYIARYSWFWCDPKSTMGPLVDGNGNPSGLGNFYTYS
ncbi:glycosyl hydrolase catalytic core-domain-containing protein [Rhexocercosporidium sp. MPI-PUGE-AT-0058]|nr:glycosyl hydrolase catalytic core-domain-containing protein [Rhexocercosporidium sp. MPI-PUGE-AT-0058]